MKVISNIAENASLEEDTKMKKWAKVLSAGALALVAGVSLTACSGTASSQSNEKVSLTIWADVKSGKDDIFLKGIEDKLKEKNVELNIVDVPMNDQLKKYSAASEADRPDIISIPNDQIAQAAQDEIIVATSSNVNENISETATKELKYNDKSYGAVKAEKTLVMYYDKSVYTEAPTEFSKILADSQARSKEGKAGLVMDMKNLFNTWGFSAGYGAKLFEEGNFKQSTINSEESVKAMKLMQELYKTMPSGSTADTMKADFLAGKASVFIDGPWAYEAIKDHKNLGVAKLPKLENGEVPKTFKNVVTWQMTKEGKKKSADGVERALKVFTSLEAAEARFKASVEVIPVNGKTFDNEVAKAVTEQLQHSIVIPSAPEMTVVWDKIKAASELVLDQGKDIKETLDNAKKQIDEANAAL